MYTHHEITPVTSAAPFAPTVLEWSWTVTLHVRLDFRALAGDAAVYDVAEETWDVTGSGSGRAEWDMGDVDLLGCRVRLLHQGPVEAGRRTFALDTVGLPAGPYVVRAIGERFTATAPFVVIR